MKPEPLPWRQLELAGHALDFAPIHSADEYLHPVSPTADYTAIETNLYGFNIPAAQIQSNIYLLWHPVLKTMSMQIFVYRGERILSHQLAADYFLEHLYLPAAEDNRDYRLQMGSCSARLRIVAPLEEILLEIDDPERRFALHLRYRAAMAPVGRPGGKHFTQLMKTDGELVLDGAPFRIDGHHVRDRSWGYARPERPESGPPYRWFTGWFGDDSAFVLAWLDDSLLDAPNGASESEAARGNKWESGGPTPSPALRSGWITLNGRPRPVVRLGVKTRLAPGSFQVQEIELEVEDADGGIHHISGRTVSMIPKMYWQNLLVLMHFMELRLAGRTGHGDLMDTYSGDHLRSPGG